MASTVEQDMTADPLLGVRRSALGQMWEQRSFVNREAEAIADRLGVPPIVGQLISARGISIEDASTFYNPSLKECMPDPSSLLDMEKGARRIVRALEQGEEIAIFGDYDVDGATSSAVLYRFLTTIGARVRIYIPDRMTEGYGPNTDALLGLRKAGVDVVITVDCGILSYDPLRAAKDAGLDVIIVDHHKAEPELPEAVAAINPNRLDDESGQGQLAAVGVAFLLVVEINRLLRDAGYYTSDRRAPDLRLLLDLVALGTVADVVPLTGANRAFVKQGLKIMAQRRNAGITALSDVGRVSEAPNAYHAGFILGPRVNAGGRVGESHLGAKLLTSDSSTEAIQIAERLDKYNEERRHIEAEVLEAALTQVEESIGIGGSPDTVVIAAGDGWHAGVIGIVASRLKDKYGLPTLVIGFEGDEGKGSARSISGVDLGAAVIEAVQQGLLIKGGGHAMAAGLSIAKGQLEEFSEFLRDHLRKQVKLAKQNRSLKVDGVIALSGATPDLIDQIEQVGPFGAGNPGPRFVIPEVDLIKADRVGQNHLRCIFKSRDGKSIKAMAFRMADEPMGEMLQTGTGRRFHIAGKLKKDTWGGTPKAEIMLDDVAIIGPV
ncbi:single-stranded-DNA-specific exonuclease RecJ [Kordiimonas laminariae]|uniref:single-stranded-DNA-specific exonuclease RecJ n=1 Tax=Kordiimonas laminariae TaxID=2917717 RepID=UPI001FF219FF|nr:single-stranded-DNA-specific exonuclease RecJ [Kordiimonas laminariae]MCK0070530.1 single-stranded-DNA-specific exonuclease RecJ [Kordiimonas laminariae]